MSCSSTYNCSLSNIVPFDADPDVAGIGVTLAFSISAGLAFTAVVIAYIFVEPLDTDSHNFYDDIARLPIQTAARYFHLQQRVGGPRLKNAVQKVAVVPSDQQLITGAAILIVGYIQHCNITQYHYEIVNDLSWLAFSTIEATIHIAEAEYRRKPAMRLWRAIWITGLWLFIFVSKLIVYNAAFLQQYGVSTQCVWDRLVNPYYYSEKAVRVNSTASPTQASLTSTSFPNQTRPATVYVSDHYLPQYTSQNLAVMIVVDLLLLWGLASMLQTLYRWNWAWLDRVDRWIDILVRLPIFLGKWCSRHIKSLRGPQQSAIAVRLTAGESVMIGLLWIVRLCAFPVTILTITIGGLLRSTILDYMRIFVLVVFSIKKIFELKAEAPQEGLDGDENTWGFGQLLPMLLIALPLTSIFESFESTFFDTRPDLTRTGEIPTDHNESIAIPEQVTKAETVAQTSGPSDGSLVGEVLAFEREVIRHLAFKMWIQVFSWGIFIAVLMLAFEKGYYF